MISVRFRLQNISSSFTNFSFQIQDISHQPTKHRVFLEAFKAEDEPDGQNELLSTILANKRGSEICRS
jgi:hypothetical protein